MRSRFRKSKASLIIFVLILSIFSVYSVSAEDYCCEKTKGAKAEYCMQLPQSYCDSGYRSAPISCEQAEYCEVGCCIDNEDGYCFKAVSEAACLAQEGTQWTNDPECSSFECSRGCCIIGTECTFETERKCEVITESYGAPFNFQSVVSELECINYCTLADEGCCHFDDGKCDFTSREVCEADAGEFYQDSFCGDIAACGCNSKAKASCYDDDVYWFDSCGNREGIKEDCNYVDGTICGQREGDAEPSCKSINCATTYSDNRNEHDNEIGGARNHGESWCIYESGVGAGLDRPGSRHFRHICINGEEVVEQCRDYREQICLQGTVETITEAQCINNLDYKSAVGGLIAASGDIEVTEFVSGVPVGHRFWESGGSTCDAGTTECTVIYAKETRMDDLECEANCECETQDYIDEMAEWCKAQGDCGADISLLGELTEGGLEVSTDSDDAPRKIGPGKASDWNVYGVYGGMIELGELVEDALADIQKEIDDAASTATTIGMIGGLASMAMKEYGASMFGTFLSTEAGTGFGKQSVAQSAGAAATIVMAVVIAVYTYMSTGGEVESYTVEVICKPWLAPGGGSGCDSCMDEKKVDKLGYYDTCSEYKCKSLGSSCEFIPENEGTDRVACFDNHPNDVNSPIITPWPESLTPGFTVETTNTGYKINPAIPAFKSIDFGIQTNELSQCKIADEHTNSYKEMTNFFGDSFYQKEHNMTLNLLPGLEYVFYIRCQDPIGNANVAEYTISMTMEDGPDLTPPRIDGTNVPSGTAVTADMKVFLLELYINEPGECRWGKTDGEFDTLTNSFSCDSAYYTSPLEGSAYDCLGTLEVDPEVDNNYYIRCRDISGNANSESFVFGLRATEALEITSTGPSGELLDTNSPVIQVGTGAGADFGAAKCYFSTSDVPIEQMIQFYETGSGLHNQELKDLSSGPYKYYVKCRDSTGNIASEIIEFAISKDLAGPSLNYIYAETSTVHVVLDEPGNCEYSDTRFNIGDGTAMSGSNSKEHTFSIDANIKHYYVNCFDSYNNDMGIIEVYL